MINSKMGVFLLAGFIAGAFVASPELRAYAANTVRSIDIVDGQVLTADLGGNSVTAAKIKDGEVKAAEIATDGVGAAEIATNVVGGSEIAADAVGTSEIAANAVGSSELATDAVGADEIAKDAVGASEIMGVDKLIFANCIVPVGFNAAPGSVIGFFCSIPSVDSDDKAVGTLAGNNNNCYVLKYVDPAGGAVPNPGKVAIGLKNICNSQSEIRVGDTVSVIVFDELPDKVPPG